MDVRAGTKRGGVLCALAFLVAAVLRGDGCGSVGVFGATDVANLGLFCPLIDATPQVARCPE